ncbi:hypothetical protein ACH5RR_037049 [Cinchona calisaya]|uniref:Uncharacterized protein n=1 Tax=Cinchona calisaya TaxID=153742 RepID=A0ABD2Y9V2_9GENT
MTFYILCSNHVTRALPSHGIIQEEELKSMMKTYGKRDFRQIPKSVLVGENCGRELGRYMHSFSQDRANGEGAQTTFEANAKKDFEEYINLEQSFENDPQTLEDEVMNNLLVR